MPPTLVRTKTISALHSRGLSESNNERYLFGSTEEISAVKNDCVKIRKRILLCILE